MVECRCSWRGATNPASTCKRFHRLPFCVVAVISASSALLFWRLPADAGAEMSGRLPAEAETERQRPIAAGETSDQRRAVAIAGVSQKRHWSPPLRRGLRRVAWKYSDG